MLRPVVVKEAPTFGVDVCVCSECGYEMEHTQRGVPCVDLECPKCGASMVGKSRLPRQITREEAKGIYGTEKEERAADPKFQRVAEPDSDESEDQGVYLVPPHGQLIAKGKKTSIVRVKEVAEIVGRRILVSGPFALAEIVIGEGEHLDLEEFKARQYEHRVTIKEQRRWWPKAKSFWSYPVEAVAAYEEPKSVVLPPGVNLRLSEIEYPFPTVEIAGKSYVAVEDLLQEGIKGPGGGGRWGSDKRESSQESAGGQVMRRFFIELDRGSVSPLGEASEELASALNTALAGIEAADIESALTALSVALELVLADAVEPELPPEEEPAIPMPTEATAHVIEMGMKDAEAAVRYAILKLEAEDLEGAVEAVTTVLGLLGLQPSPNGEVPASPSEPEAEQPPVPEFESWHEEAGHLVIEV